MGELKNNVSGFTALEGLLIVIVIAFISFAGYYTWQNQQNSNTTQTASSTDAQSQNVTTKQPASAQYLSIKQFGIKMPVPSNVGDIAYSWDGKSASVYSVSLLKYAVQQDPSECSPSSNVADKNSTSYPLGNISTVRPYNDGPVGSQEAYPEVTVGKATYYWAGPQSGCASSQSQGAINAGNAVTAAEQAAIKAFESSTALN